MPIIEELEDDYDLPQDENPPDEQLAARALETSLLILNGQLPLDARYSTILSMIPPIERFLSSTPPPSITKLQPGLLQLLQPRPELSAELTSFDPEDAEARVTTALHRFHTLSTKLLTLLAHLELAPTLDLVVTLASFTCVSDSWTTPTTYTLASGILTKHEATFSTPEILIDGILTQTLRPLFRHATQSTSHVTAAGRLSIRDPTPSTAVSTPAWQLHLPATPTLLEHTLTHLPTTHLDTAWALLIPPILTITDSPSTTPRWRGILLITQLLTLLESANSTLLTRTGLAPLFWSAATPAFSYLPAMTPVSESTKLLTAAFPCLRKLAVAREPNDRRKRAALLDQLVREGYAHGLTFAGEHPAVVRVLCKEVQAVVQDLGVYAVRHLRLLTRTLADVLANPLGNAEPEVLREAAETLVVVMQVCWMRVEAHAPEVLRGCVLCWKRIKEDERDGVVGVELRRVKVVLRKVVRMLGVVLGEDGERWMRLSGEIVRVDKELEELFEVVEIA